MKNQIFFRRTFLLVICMCLFAVLSLLVGCDSIGSADTDPKETIAPNVVETTANKNNLGDYNVEILSCRLSEDYEGKPIVIVKYSFSNHSDEAASFSFSITDKVYQNGIGLDACYFAADSAEYASDQALKEIKSGVTLEVERAYELNDTTSDIEVEVSELFSFSDRTVTKTFKMP